MKCNRPKKIPVIWNTSDNGQGPQEVFFSDSLKQTLDAKSHNATQL